ncbi:MAG: helix-turn-helix domain-containing protein [Erysipelotrichaceae bacterium]|nr:helix-turn-helix domain-containing protein [Erysipelotrichaceae bacterium]
MRDLLTSPQKRQLLIIENLFSSKEWIHINDIAKKMNCSDRIIKNDISNIKRNFTNLKIDSSSKGIKLADAISFDLSYVYQTILAESESFKILEYIFLNDKCSLSNLYKSIFISKSTIYRIIGKINAVIRKKFDFQIKSNPFTIVGNEKDIRCFFSQYFSERYNVLDWPFKTINEYDFTNFLSLFTNYSDIYYDFARFRLVKITSIVNLIRAKNNNFLHLKDVSSNEYYQELIEKESFKDFIKLYSQKFNIQLDFPVLEQIFIGFVQKNFYFSYEQLKEHYSTNPQTKKSIDLLKKIIMELSVEFGLRITNLNQLLLYMHDTSFLDKFEIDSYFILNNKKYYPLSVLKSYFPLFYTTVQNKIIEYRENLNYSTDEQIINHLIYTLFTHWEGLFDELFKKLHKIKAIVISDFDLQHSISICSALNFYTSDRFTAEPYSKTYLSLSELEKSEYDLILTTFEINDKLNKPIFNIGKMVTFDIIEKLRFILEQIYKEKNIFNQL